MRARVTASCVVLLLAIGGAAHADTVIETETGELGAQGDVLISQSFQFERSADGTAFGTLDQLEYGITDRAEILIEPFFFESEQPKDGDSFSGLGDLELTPSYMVVTERPAIPALVLAFKLKVPTARNREIGTGKFDYYPYIIVGKHFGTPGREWIFNGNLGVDFITPTDGGKFEKQVIWDLELQRMVTDRLGFFAEGFTDESGVMAGAVAAEVDIRKHVQAFLSVGYDADNTVIARPGFNVLW